MPASIAIDLFQEYTGPDAAAVLSSLIDADPAVVETTWREFKAGFIRPDDFNRIWSEILGAFANTEGGVVVFGIRADTLPEKQVDAAHKIVWVQNVDLLVTKLKKAAKDAINPPLHDVQYVAVPEKAGESRGFVVCLVPEGRDKPYESLHCRERFVGRFDDRCEKLPLSWLRKLFFPSLTPNVRLKASSPGDEHGQYSFTFEMVNDGPMSIEAGFLTVAVSGHTLAFGAPRRHAQRFETILERFIHPSQSTKDSLDVLVVQSQETLKITVVLYQRNAPPVRADLTYSVPMDSFTSGDRDFGRKIEQRLAVDDEA